MDQTSRLFLKGFPTSSTVSNLISSNFTNDSTIENFTETLINENESNVTEDINEYVRIYPALKQYKGIVDSKYIERINAFWLHFEPSSPQTHYTIAVIYIIIMVVGCCGNALVIFMFIRCKSLRTPANILVVNLAISDFFMVAKGPIAIYNSFNLGPALGDLGCRIYGFVGGLTGTASIMTLTAISIDRYHVVVYPLDPIHSTTKRHSILMVTIVWFYSFIFSIIPALDIGLSHYVPEGLLTTCSFDYLSKSIKAKIFMFTFFIAAWCIPFTTITYCYFYILKIVIAASSIQSNKDKNKTELKLATIVIIIIGLWFLAWTPYAIVALLGISGNEYLITPISSMIPAIFCKTSACIDPYVYAVSHPRFKMEFSRIFLGKTVRRQSTYRSSFTRISRSHSSTSRQLVEICNFRDTNLKENQISCSRVGSSKSIERQKSFEIEENEERF